MQVARPEKQEALMAQFADVLQPPLQFRNAAFQSRPQRLPFLRTQTSEVRSRQLVTNCGLD